MPDDLEVQEEILRMELARGRQNPAGHPGEGANTLPGAKDAAEPVSASFPGERPAPTQQITPHNALLVLIEEFGVNWREAVDYHYKRMREES